MFIIVGSALCGILIAWGSRALRRTAVAGGDAAPGGSGSAVASAPDGNAAADGNDAPDGEVTE